MLRPSFQEIFYCSVPNRRLFQDHLVFFRTSFFLGFLIQADTKKFLIFEHPITLEPTGISSVLYIN